MANVKQIKINDTIYDVEDSVARSALEQKAPLESPALTGIPTAPTASKGTSTTQIATTAFVQNAVQDAGGSYTLPVASSTTLGGVKPVAKTASMTQEVGVDASGALYTADVPVKKVNGATGEVKSTFYVTVTPTGSGYAATADKTADEVYAAYEAGYAVYAIVPSEELGDVTLPLAIAVDDGTDKMMLFATTLFQDLGVSPTCLVVFCISGAWLTQSMQLAKESDIPTIPTALKNPYSLNIKIGNATTSYDGSAAKTVEIPKGVPAVTAADNGKILRVVNGAWAAAELLNAGGVSF